VCLEDEDTVTNTAASFSFVIVAQRTVQPCSKSVDDYFFTSVVTKADEHTDACHVCGFHDFKRAFATNNASSLSPAQLQRLMKHSDFSTTQNYINYAKVMTEKPNVFVPDVLKQEHGGRADSR
jgi:integrase